MEEREDLGWLAQSSTIPKKRKTIEGVTGSSLIDLQAQFYRGQEAVTNGSWKELSRKSKRHAGIALFEKKNAGVEERINKDEQQIKSSDDKLNESRAALERKAELYDKLARGEVEDEDDQYEVDFFTKSKYTNRGRSPNVKDKRASVNDHLDIDSIIEKHELEQQIERKRKQFHKEMVMEVAKETTENRGKAAEIKEQKDSQLRDQRQKLKEAFLKQQLKKLKEKKKQKAQGESSKG